MGSDLQKAEDECTEPQNIWLRHPALVASLATVAIAIVSAGMLLFLSGDESAQGLLSKLPPTIETFSFETQMSDGEAIDQGEEVRSSGREAVKEPDKEEATVLTEGSRPEEEEIRGTDEASEGDFSQGGTEEADGDLADDGRSAQTVPTVVVTVQKGDTIDQILKGRFGKSGTMLMALVRELNPEMEDLDLIRVGQEIRLPLNPKTAGQIPSLDRGLNEQPEEQVQREHTTESF